jgi:ferric-dicitrate binding protein FerR (iron transport regulator)
MMNDQPSAPDTDEDVMMKVLRLAGSRPEVPAARANRVRAAVHSAWLASSRRRALRRRALFATGALATAAVLLLSIARWGPYPPSVPTPGDVVAKVEYTVGPAEVPANSDRSSAPLAAGDAVRAGAWIETAAAARVAIRFADGTSLRLDRGTRVRPLSASAVELAAGAVYVDSDREEARFEVRTATATARDIGTQFEVRLIGDVLRLRVRSGTVELADDKRSVVGRAGTEITMTADSATSRPFAPFGVEWDWAAQTAPPVEMEGQTLAAFLGKLAREHGWNVQYADAAVKQEAARITLHGSVIGLTPRDAVEVAVSTSALEHRFDEGTLVVLPGARRQ